MIKVDTHINYFGQGQCFQIWNVERDSVTYNIVYIILGGKGQYIDVEKEIEFKKNHLYILPANRHYLLKRFPEEPLDHIWFHVDIFPALDRNSVIEFNIDDKKYIRNIVDSISCRIKDSLRYWKKNSKLLDRMVKDDNYVSGFAPLTMQNQIQDLPGYTNNFNILNALLICLLTCVMQEERQNIFLIDNPYVEKAFQFIRKHYREDIDNQTIADHLNISRLHLIKIFKQKMNTTPHKFLLNYRVSMADLFLSHGLNISETAEQVGIEPQSLSRVYRRIRGYAPREAKKLD
ncbi:MAG TPA: hypothetical protein DD727_04190 [Clostridiales bacterium]|nr:hypothetical protein [Clostridiales bacterium]